MAKHVFVEGLAASFAATYDLGNNSNFNGNGIGELGVWSLDLSDHLDGTTGGQEVLLGTIAAGTQAIIPSRFQITQNTTANRPYASPIIERGRLKRITYTPFLTSVTATTGSVAQTAYAAGKTHSIKIVKLSGYDNYEEFLNPSGSYDDRTPQIRNYSCTHSGGNLTASIAAMGDAINNDAGAFVTAAYTTSNITFTAKDKGTSFQVIDVSVELDATNGLAVAAGSLGKFVYTAGSGDGYKAVEAEKKSRFHGQGSMNRVHFANTPEMFASAAQDYDILRFECDNGIQGDTSARKDQLTIEMWMPAALDVSNGGCFIDSMFIGLDDTSAAGDTVVLYDAGA